MMKLLPVVSSTVLAVGHDGEHTLTVQYRSGTYEYWRVPPVLFDALLSAESIGKFLHTQVKPYFPYRLVATPLQVQVADTIRVRESFHGISYSDRTHEACNAATQIAALAQDDQHSPG